MRKRLDIPRISTEEVLVSIIDELKYKLKARIQENSNSDMLDDFNEELNKFIDKWNLGSDKHMFASLPER